MLGIKETFNPRSPKQVLDYLKSQGIRLSDTSEETLLVNKDKHDLISSLLELRTLVKLNGTLTGYRKWIDKDSLIHSDFATEGAETGRSASRNPNCQNVDPKARVIFTSRYPGGKLIQSDLSQLEYRLIAFATRDETLLKIFKDGKDIHSSAASLVYNKPIEQITKAERKEAKTLNYGSIYGCGKDRFYGMLGREDEALFYKAKALYPGVTIFKRKMEAQINHTGTVTNMFGRSRRFSGELDYSTFLEAFNGLFQSAGHSITKIVGIDLHNKLLGTDCLLVNECHDSFITDSRPENVQFVLDTIKSININHLIKEQFSVELDIPMFLETEVSDEWK